LTNTITKRKGSNMIFESLADVPKEIVEFYYEETVSEPTGDFYEEAATDADGIEYSTQVPIMHDVVYLREVNLGETKTDSDLTRVIKLGKPKSVIDRFLTCVEVGYRDEFWQTYLVYLEQMIEWNELKDAFLPNAINEDGELIDGVENVFSVPEPEKPVRYTPTEEVIYQAHDEQAFKIERTKLVNEITVEVDDLVFDGDELSQGRMTRAIISLDEDEQMPWTLADNSVTLVTQDILKRAVKLAGAAQSELWVNPHTKQAK